jgi:hypothetical protein
VRICVHNTEDILPNVYNLQPLYCESSTSKFGLFFFFSRSNLYVKYRITHSLFRKCMHAIFTLNWKQILPNLRCYTLSLQYRPRCTVQTFFNLHMLPTFLHRAVVNTFEGKIKFTPLRPGQLLEFKPPSAIESFHPHIICPYVFQEGAKWVGKSRGCAPCWRGHTNKTRVKSDIPTKSYTCMSTSWLLDNVYTAK